MGLSQRIAVAIGAVLALAAIGSLAFILFAYQARDLMESLVRENVASVRAAEELEIALLEQKGLVAYFILGDGDERWIEVLLKREPEIQRWRDAAVRTATTLEERQIIDELMRVYTEFDARRDEAVDMYRAGNFEAAEYALLHDVQALFDRAHALCELYLAANEAAIHRRMDADADHVDKLRWLAIAYLVVVCVIAAALASFVFREIVAPLRRIAEEAGGSRSPDAVRDVGERVLALMSDVDETRESLERSRQQLVTSERLASVGKLAASVAHEIRNPLTSMKMRLFYLRNEVGVDPRYEDDFRVISEEVSRLESVVRNFLEFSRPPDLRIESNDVADLLDRTLELCSHRLEAAGIDVQRHLPQDLPEVLADSEQTMQVFLNLMLNASEAMPDGGRLTLRCAVDAGLVHIDFCDTGGGVLEEIRHRVFEPFFSTKEEGTGLGLAIAARIMERQGGALSLASTSTEGTVFRVELPANEPAGHADRPDR